MLNAGRSGPVLFLIGMAMRNEIIPVQEGAMRGGMEGASRLSRELMSWQPAVISPDRQIDRVKDLADARGRDIVQNNGYALGAVHTHRDSIVGSQYRLNSQPDYETIGADEKWAEEFQRVVEGRFNLAADSEECWLDASRSMTLTGMVRLAVGGFVMTGEVLGTVEWMREMGRPFSTALQFISPTRLSNPDDRPDEKNLRRGIVRDRFGAPKSYWIRTSYPGDFWDYATNGWTWVNVPARKPWGRRQVIHLVDRLLPDQSRGIADMVSVLKEMRMTKRFQDVTLQNAVVQASYAAAVESELPSDVVFASMGAGGDGMSRMLGDYLTALQTYVTGGNAIAVDGVKMPHLFPGTKLSLKPMGTPGGVGTNFEESLHRNIAAGLGLNYEQFARDYTKTNYSSARASMAETWKGMQSKKKNIADRTASMVFALWFEEDWNAGNLPVPAGRRLSDFYTDPMFREALLRCTWIGASRGQIDEMKETQAAVLRIKSGLSTYEEECSRLGNDFRHIFRQRAREDRMAKELGLSFDLGATKPGMNEAKNAMTSTGTTSEKDDEDGDE